MKKLVILAVLAAVVSVSFGKSSKAEILAMMNYETKTPGALKAVKLPPNSPRKEGIAIIDVDPNSLNFGKILMDVPLAPDLVAHHIFYDREQQKAYVTALGKSVLHIFDMQQFPYKLKRIDLPDCKLGEDVIFSEDNKTWYVTCMMSARYIEGDVATDKVKRVVKLPDSYPHGLAVATDLDRILVSNTVSGDLKDARDEIIIVQASTGKELKRIRVSKKPGKAGEAPVEILRVPGSNPPVHYVTNMFGGSLWALKWNSSKKDFDATQVFDFKPLKAGVPLEMYFNHKADRMYVTTAAPGRFHTFDMSAGAMNPKRISTLVVGDGAHHVAITKDEKYGFVQSALLNLPGMDDGSVTVVDLQTLKVVKSMDTLKNMGFNPNSIVLLPPWNEPGGH
ncbi:MAG: YncE family protein [Proteobacteria bacterium]|nr:YncE family protein [Pseudomonadota bacterium]MDA1023109.1 YncE family protein [Pseudomonadota bacterium]